MPCDSPTKEEVAALEKSENNLSFFIVGSFSECTLRCLEIKESRPHLRIKLYLGPQEVIGESTQLTLV